jgi:hypothetical protein
MAGSVEKIATGTARSDVGVPYSSCKVHIRLYQHDILSHVRISSITQLRLKKQTRTSGHRATT